MAEPHYWFARRFPVGTARSGMSPVSREGWLVVATFVGGMVLGGLAFLLLGLNGQFIAGIIVFVLMAIFSGGMFIGMAMSRGDQVNTVEDYRAGRVK
jgi:hypothetical protein